MVADRRTIVSIQYLRAIAAIMVVYHHGWDQLPWFKARFPFEIGAAGVDLFFVISGFVMVFITQSKPQTSLEFIEARAIRIVPLYWVCTLSAALLLIAAPRLFSKNEFTVEHLLLSMFFIPHPNPALPSQLSPLVKLGWTLNYEVFFYSIFAVGMRLFGSASAAFTAVVMLILVIIGAYFGDGAPLVVREFYTNPIIFEFVLGMAIGVLYNRGAFKVPGLAVGFVIILLSIAGLVLSAEYFPTAPRVFTFGLSGALALIGALSIESSSMVPIVRPLQLLGDASYSIYLWHLFPIAIVRAAWKVLDIPTEGWGNVFCFVSICVVVGVFGGISSYFLIERPSLNALRNLISKRRMKPHVELPRGMLK